MQSGRCILLPLDLPGKLLGWSSSQILRPNIVLRKEKEQVFLSFLAYFEIWTSHCFTSKSAKAEQRRGNVRIISKGVFLHCITLTSLYRNSYLVSMSCYVRKLVCSGQVLQLHPSCPECSGLLESLRTALHCDLLLPFSPNHRTCYVQMQFSLFPPCISIAYFYWSACCWLL